MLWKMCWSMRRLNSVTNAVSWVCVCVCLAMQRRGKHTNTNTLYKAHFKNSACYLGHDRVCIRLHTVCMHYEQNDSMHCVCVRCFFFYFCCINRNTESYVTIKVVKTPLYGYDWRHARNCAEIEKYEERARNRERERVSVCAYFVTTKLKCHWMTKFWVTSFKWTYEIFR